MKANKIPIISFFVGQPLKWVSTRSTQQILKEIGRLPGHRLFGTGGQFVTAEVLGSKFSIRCSGFAGIGMSGNAFEHIGFGQVNTAEAGSEVILRFRARLHVIIFFTVWMTGAIAGSLMILTASIYHLITGKSDWQNSAFGILFSIVFMSFAFIFPWSCRKLAAKNEVKIVNAISNIIQAEPTPLS